MKFLQTIFLLLVLSPSFAQQKDSISYDNSFSFYLNLNYQDSYKETHFGKQQLLLKPFISFETGFEYHHSLNDYLEVGFGLKIGAIPYNEKITIVNSDSLKPYYSDGTYNGYDRDIYDIYLNPTFSFKSNLIPIKSYTLYSEIGIGLNILPPYDNDRRGILLGDSTGTREIEIFESNIKSDGRWINPSYFLKIGMSKKKNRHIFNYGIVFNYMPKNIRTGSYNFLNIENPSYGDIELRINYIGLEFSYGIGLKKQKINYSRTLF